MLVGHEGLVMPQRMTAQDKLRALADGAAIVRAELSKQGGLGQTGQAGRGRTGQAGVRQEGETAAPGLRLAGPMRSPG
jgi:hypothetical protein